MKLDRIVSRLDRELKVADFDDHSHNGLQVANTGHVDKVCCGVDASQAFFEAAVERGAQLVVCHHGLSWGDSLKRITDLNYRRLAYLIKHDLAVYGCHLPLDAHPRCGNNVQLARALGLQGLRRFGLYKGQYIGYQGQLPKAMSYARFKQRLQRVAPGELRSMDFGKKTIRTVAVVSGGAAAEIVEAGQKQVDVYVSGEASLAAYHQAQEYGINAVFAGHYATETFGVKALAGWLKRRLKVDAEFVDLAIPF